MKYEVHFLIFIVSERRDNHIIIILGAEEEDKVELENSGLKIHRADETLVTKRIESYLQGGIFAPTAKTLILDLLSKKLSPHVISGFVILNAETSLKGTHAQGMYGFMSNVCFCLKMYKRDNKEGFVKVLCSNPNKLSFKGNDIKDFMKASYTDKLVLYPRIRSEVKQDIEEGETSQIIEAEIQMNSKMQKCHEIIIQLLHFCIEIMEKELEKYQLEEEFFSPNKILAGNYTFSLRYELKNEFFDISSKAKICLRDIESCKLLITTLLESDPISFHLILSNCKDNKNPSSIFVMSYEEVETLVESLTRTNLERIYTITKKKPSNFKNSQNLGSKSPPNPFSEKWKFSSVGEFTKENSEIWETYAENMTAKHSELKKVEEEFEGEISKD